MECSTQGGKQRRRSEELTREQDTGYGWRDMESESTNLDGEDSWFLWL
jgi:hypothetical protein